jgi:hypothetical protein
MHSHQNSNDTLHRNSKNNHKIHTETQKILNNQIIAKQRKKKAMLEVLQYLASNYPTEL